MKVVLYAVLSASMSLPTVSAAQMVSSGQTSEICPGRPNEPPIIQNMPVQEAYRTLLLQAMYSAYRYELVVQTGTCSCENRFPSWEPVVEYYLENYARLEDEWDVMDAQRPYDAAKRLHREPHRTICVQQGNWR